MGDKGWMKAVLIGSGIYAILQILGMIPCVGCLLCPINMLSWFVLPVGVGVLTASWEKLNKNNLNDAAMALLKSGLLFAGINVLVFIVFQILSAVINSVFNIGLSSYDSMFNDNGDYAALSGFATLFGGVLGAVLCGGFNFLKDLILVMIGGIITAAIREK